MATIATRVLAASAVLIVVFGCNQQKPARRPVAASNSTSSDIYDIDYGDGLLTPEIIVFNDASQLEKYAGGELRFPKSTMYLATPYDQHNISQVTSHETLTPGIRVILTENSTPEASRKAFNCPVIYKLSVVNWTPRRFREMPDDACQGVRFLKLRQCVLDEVTLRRIGQLPSLEGLWLTQCKLAETDLKFVTQPLKNRLKVLSLFHSGFSDEASTAVNELRTLYVLRVSEPAITDRFFERLQAPLLNELEVAMGGPPSDGIAKTLKSDRPALKIQRAE